jgi:hypothetical protein
MMRKLDASLNGRVSWKAGDFANVVASADLISSLGIPSASADPIASLGVLSESAVACSTDLLVVVREHL